MKKFSAYALAVLLSASSFAADPPAKPKAEPAATPKKEPAKPKPTFIDAKDAGIDYVLQGEYEGSAGDKKWGAQVVALGDGKFHAVFMPGGLPGVGWDAVNRYESEGILLEGKNVTFKGVEKVAWEDGHISPKVQIKLGFEATIADDTLTGKTDKGEAFTLKKTLRHSPNEGAKPPEGAIVLFDGSNIDAWTGTKLLDGGLMKEGAETKQKFTDFTVHVEFRLPFQPFARGQGRGNSGVYLQHRYECQVLDSFGIKGMDNQCGGIYTKSAPTVNMAFPPLTWQTYDIEFTAARYSGGKKVSDAVITSKLNGVLIQDHFKADGPTGGGQKEVPTEDVQTGPLHIQNHGNPVMYRNIWIVEKK